MTDTDNQEKADIVARLNDIWSNDDHERRCEGRNYSCTCGFDERTCLTAKEAAAEIERLRGYLTRIACLSQDTDLLWWQVQARAALVGGQQNA